MNPGRIGLFAVALLVAAAMVFFGRQLLGTAPPANPNQPVAPVATTRVAKAVTTDAPTAAPALQVLVARTDIRTGQIVKPDDLRWQAWPDGTIAPSYIVQGRRPLSDFVGAVARGPVAVGEPITEGRVVLSGTRGFMAAVLQPGMRAVSIPVTATSGISGFVFAGDRVDLILTHGVGAGETQGKERQASETILRDVRVIAMDQRLDVRPGERPEVAKTATLEVTPKQAEIITLAQEMGKLSLSLRSLQDPVDADGSSLARANDGDNSFTRDNHVSRLLGGPTGTVLAAPTITILRGPPVSLPNSGSQGGAGTPAPAVALGGPAVAATGPPAAPPVPGGRVQ